MRRVDRGRDDATRGRLLTGVICLAALAALAAHAWRYYPFMSDDAFISLRYAERLLAGEGLTWNDGERVEGYSNLLWVLATSLLGLAGMELVTAARVLGSLGMGAALLALAWFHRPSSPARALPAAASTLSLAACGCFAIWAVGGLEQGLVAGLLAWSVALTYRAAFADRSSFRSWIPPGALLGLICITRPDGILFTAAIALALFAGARFRLSGLLRGTLISLPSLIAFCGQLVFRLAYYGEWVPNTALGKLVLTSERLSSGAAYLGEGSLYMAGLMLPAAGAVFLAITGRVSRQRILIAGAPFAVWASYVVLIGGDIFWGFRHLVPLAVLGSLMAAELWGFLASSARRANRRAGWCLAAASLALLTAAQLGAPSNTGAVEERWEWDGEVVGGFLAEAFGESGATIAADPAGCIPYFSRLRAIDMLGLNDRHIAHNPPPDLGRGWLGHELGDGGYVLDREPDLVLFCQPRGRAQPCFRSGKQMVKDPRFREHYLPIEIEGRVPRTVRSFLWVRGSSERVGVVKRGGEVIVPGHLFARPEKGVATLDEEGRVGALLAPGGQARLYKVDVGPGPLRVDLESSGGPVRLRIHEGKSKVTRDGEGFWHPAATSGARLTLELTAGEERAVHVRRVVIRAGRI